MPGELDVDAHWGQADLHLHTRASDGLMSARALVDWAEKRTDLDVIAITDHDEVSAALDGREWATRNGYRIQVVPGVEVTTRQGHLLALFVEERPPALRGVLETAEWVLQRGGLCIAAHPFTRFTHSLQRAALEAVAERGLLAAVEILNASPAGRASRARAEAYALEAGLPGVGGSDAHMLGVTGLARTRFHGQTPAGLRRAIENAACYAEGRFARTHEVAAEALPQLARSLLHLPLRRVVRFGRDVANRGRSTPPITEPIRAVTE